MPKKDEEIEITDQAESQADAAPAEPAEPPKPFEPPPAPQNSAPTEAQHEWMRKHPKHVRTSHGLSGAGFAERGTLHQDGTFVPEHVAPIVDSGSCFGVGVPIGRNGRI